MSDHDKTKTRLVEEIASLRRRVAELEREHVHSSEAARVVREDAQKYRILTEETNDIPYSISAEGILTYVGPQVRLYGFQPEDLLSRDFLEVISPADRERVAADFQRSLSTGEEFPTEFRVRDHAGRDWWFEERGKARRDARGNIVAFTGALRDITERKKVEEHLGAAMAHSPIATVVISDGGSIVMANKAAEALSGYRADEMRTVSESTARLYPDSADREKAIRATEAIRKGERPETNTHTIVCKDGQTRVIEIHVSLFDGGYVLQCLDVTNQKKSVRDLRASEKRYRTLVDHIPAVTYIALLDETSSIAYVSPQIESLIGFPPSECRTDPGIWHRQLHPEDRERVMAEMHKAHQTDEPFVSEYRMLTKDGRVISIHDEAVIARNDAGEPEFLQGVMHDITERKRAEETIQQYQDQLRRLASEVSLSEERERRRLAQILHDDISQNLALARIRLSQAETRAGAGELAASLAEIAGLVQEAIDRTRSLMFDISPPALYELGLEAALERLCEEADARHSFELRFENDASEKPLRQEISLLLYQAARELLMNVVKHAGARHVAMSVRRKGEAIRVAVEDDGVGSDVADMWRKIRRHEGFGLFSIRERLRHFGGRMEVRSRTGKGTRITMAAPLAIAMPGEATDGS